jgi:sugar/nucleoside kinase (ribokinase family)
MAFEYGAKVPAEKINIYTGGTAVNISVGLKRQGIETAIFCALGKDSSGDSVFKTLTKEGVETDGVQIFSKHRTARSLIILDKKTGERTIFSDKRIDRDFNPNCSLIKSPCIYLSSLKDGWQKKMAEVARIVSLDKKRLFFNPGSRQLRTGLEIMEGFLKKVEILFLNFDEALELVRAQEDITPEEMARLIFSAGPKIVAITNGEDGAFVFDGEKMYHEPIVPGNKILDTTGAGDAFASGFLAVYLRGGDLEVAMKSGICNAASVVEHLGSLKGLLKN